MKISKKREKKIVNFLINCIIVADVIWCIYRFFSVGGNGNMTVKNWECFKYYTIDSNILCAIGCVITAIEIIKELLGKESRPAGWKVILKFSGVVAVMVTFLVVVLFLGPTIGYEKMYTNTNMYLHGINPILAIISFLIFDEKYKFPKKKLWWGDLSVLVYGIIYFIMVVIVKKWNDFYGFATVLKWYVSFPAMLLFGLLLSFIVWKLYTYRKSD